MTLRKPLIAGIVVLSGLSLLSLGAAAVAGQAASAARIGGWQPGSSGRPPGALIRQRLARLRVLKDDLALSDRQRQDIKETLKAHRRELVPLIRAVADRRDDVREAVLAENPDEQAIRSAAESLGQAIGDLAVKASEVAGEIRPLITAEQLDTLREFRPDRRAALDELLDRFSGE